MSQEATIHAQYNAAVMAQSAEQARISAADVAREAEYERMRPFMVLRPRMLPDGNQWCALYGENLQEGVAGFGDTPEKAAEAFDKAWRTDDRHAPSRLFNAAESGRGGR